MVKVENETIVANPSLLKKECDGHVGVHRILVRGGRNEWRYYGLTPTQLRFWRGLPKAEQNSLVRAQERQCLVCALEQAIRMRKRLADGFYSSMMVSLLTAGGRVR